MARRGMCKGRGTDGTFDDRCLREFYKWDAGSRCRWWTRLKRCCGAAASPGAHDRRSVKHMSQWREACLQQSKSKRRCCGAIQSCVCHAVQGVKEMSRVREPRTGESKSRKGQNALRLPRGCGASLGSCPCLPLCGMTGSH